MESFCSGIVPPLSLLSELLHLYLLILKKKHAEITLRFLHIYFHLKSKQTNKKLLFYVLVSNRRGDNHIWSNYLDYLEIATFTLFPSPYLWILYFVFSLEYENVFFSPQNLWKCFKSLFYLLKNHFLIFSVIPKCTHFCPLNSPFIFPRVPTFHFLLRTINNSKVIFRSLCFC